MRILNEQDEEIQESDVNYTLGYLRPDQILKEHHDAIPEVKEEGHYYPETFYFMDGSQYKVDTEGENDPCVEPNEDGVSFNYVAPKGEEPREYKGCDVKYIIDVEYQDAKEAYDEMEDIQRYKLYTEEELEDAKWPTVAGSPCSVKSNQQANGVGCSYYAMNDINPDDNKSGYWKNLPK